MSREEDAYVIERMGKLLAEIAIIVNGTEPHDTLWSYHDLPEKVRALKQAQQPAAAAPEGFAALVDAADNAYDSAEGVAYVEFYRREPVEKLLAACRAMLAAAKGKGNE